MPTKRKPKSLIKGSTVCLATMYVSCILYVALSIAVFACYGTWLPDMLTLCFFAVFAVETVALSRLKMAKEGQLTKDAFERVRGPNSLFSRAGMPNMPDFDAETEEIFEKQEGRHVRSNHQ